MHHFHWLRTVPGFGLCDEIVQGTCITFTGHGLSVGTVPGFGLCDEIVQGTCITFTGHGLSVVQLGHACLRLTASF